MGIGDGWLAKERVKPDGNAVGGADCSGRPSALPGGVIQASNHVSGIRSCCYVVYPLHGCDPAEQL